MTQTGCQGIDEFSVRWNLKHVRRPGSEDPHQVNRKVCSFQEILHKRMKKPWYGYKQVLYKSGKNFYSMMFYLLSMSRYTYIWLVKFLFVPFCVLLCLRNLVSVIYQLNGGAKKNSLREILFSQFLNWKIIKTRKFLYIWSDLIKVWALLKWNRIYKIS